MRQALIIFVRKPELGKVKTRLAAALGNEAALEIYESLLLHTLKITKPVPADKYVFYTGGIELNDIWSEEGFCKFEQTGNDLGERMYHAFGLLFSKGYRNISIIGSDCYDLNTEIIEAAFEKLENNDLVIGPAVDGGFYLLGLKQLDPVLFLKRTWSTNTVYAETIQLAEKLKLSAGNLPVLNDVDEVADVPAHLLS